MRDAVKVILRIEYHKADVVFKRNSGNLATYPNCIMLRALHMTALCFLLSSVCSLRNCSDVQGNTSVYYIYLCVLYTPLCTIYTSVYCIYLCVLYIHLCTIYTSVYCIYLCVLYIPLCTIYTYAYYIHLCVLYIPLCTLYTSVYDIYLCVHYMCTSTFQTIGITRTLSVTTTCFPPHICPSSECFQLLFLCLVELGSIVCILHTIHAPVTVFPFLLIPFPLLRLQVYSQTVTLGR